VAARTAALPATALMATHWRSLAISAVAAQQAHNKTLLADEET